MSNRVTSKGQVTIPKPVRDLLGIQPGTAVKFEPDANGRIVFSKSETGRQSSRFDALRGCAGPGLSTEQIMALTRGEP